jgi:acetate kinase
MSQTKQAVLTLNGGSSSIKFAVFIADKTFTRLLTGKLDRIGLTGASLSFDDLHSGLSDCLSIEVEDFTAAAKFLLDWLEHWPGFADIRAAGHRVVHGMHHCQPEIISEALIQELQRISPCDPDHLPGEITLMKLIRHRYPDLPQAACFDTAFHHSLPRVASLLPIPRRFDTSGIRRYGFHGLSYGYLMQQLGQIDKNESRGRVILAHLGNGASLAAVCDGRSLDTSMGFTPAGGIMMGTRPGDLDPGVAWFMLQQENLDAESFNHLINHNSGLLGVSETSSDIRDLMQQASGDVRAAEALALFCYQVKKNIGAYAAVLDGLDTLVFAGGIGENAASIRARICEGLSYLGLELDAAANANNAAVISSSASRVIVRVMHTDEESMIAQSVDHLLGISKNQE